MSVAGIKAAWRQGGQRTARPSVQPHEQWRCRAECVGDFVDAVYRGFGQPWPRLSRGGLEQWDTSEHDWLEGRGEEILPINLIDDATSRWFARFVSSDSP